MSLLLLGVSNDVVGAPATFYILLEDAFIILTESGNFLIQE